MEEKEVAAYYWSGAMFFFCFIDHDGVWLWALGSGLETWPDGRRRIGGAHFRSKLGEVAPMYNGAQAGLADLKKKKGFSKWNKAVNLNADGYSRE